MNRSTNLVFAAVASFGLAAVAAPVIAQQTQMKHDRAMGGGMDMPGGHADMMRGAMATMGGAQSHTTASFDADKDGVLSPEEMTAGVQAELKTYDTDADGAISLDEFAVMHAAHTRPMTVRAFQMHDADGDAQVTEAELTAMVAMMQSHMGGRQDDMPGNGMMGKN